MITTRTQLLDTISDWWLRNDLFAGKPLECLQLAGAAVPMALAAANLAREIGLTAGQLHQLTTVNPRVALGACGPAPDAGGGHEP